jgi:uncharacterized LabA/DUF88 family protein
MDRAALFVDLGYLLDEGAKLVFESPVKVGRHEYDVSYGNLMKFLMGRVTDHSGLPLLRTYCYDGVYDSADDLPGSRLNEGQKKLRDMPLIKLRLGSLSRTTGKQKGVDPLIFRDLTTLARERSIVAAYLVAGDEDLREAVAMAQDYGVQVFLVPVVPYRGGNTSPKMLAEVDDALDLDQSDLQPFYSRDEPRSTDPALVDRLETMHERLNRPGHDRSDS